MKKTLQLKGLDCAACAAELEEELAATEGVTSVSVTFVTQKLTVECESEKVLALVKDKANHFEEVQVVEEAAPTVARRKTEKFFCIFRGCIVRPVRWI